MRIRRLRPTVLAAAVIAPLAMTQAQQPTLEELLQRIEQQDQAIKVLERKLELQEEATKTTVASQPQVTASEKGFSLVSADSANRIRLRGTLHIDGRSMLSDEADLPDTFQI